MPTHLAGDIGRQARATSPLRSSGVPTEEVELIVALRRRDESAFCRLVSLHQSSLLRVARMYVGSQAVAEEVVQETWMGVLKGLDNFEARCSVKAWIFQILINRAKTRGEREGRMIPFSAMFDPQSDRGEPAVDPSQFNENDSEWPGGWVTQPRNWGANPEQSLLSQEFKAYTQAAIESLPLSQREVITLRDDLVGDLPASADHHHSSRFGLLQHFDDARQQGLRVKKIRNESKSLSKSGKGAELIVQSNFAEKAHSPTLLGSLEINKERRYVFDVPGGSTDAINFGYAQESVKSRNSPGF